MKRVRGQKNCTDVNNIRKEIVTVIDFESIIKEFLNDRIEMLLRIEK